MLYFKACMRCKEGAVELGSDNFGSFLTCISCGYTINSRSIRANGSIEEPSNMDLDAVVAPSIKSEVSDYLGERVGKTPGDDFGPGVAGLEEEFEPTDLDLDEIAAI